MECMIRIADEKYMKKNAPIASNYYEAVDMMLKDHFQPILDTFDS